LPTLDDVKARKEISIAVDTDAIVTDEFTRLNGAADAGDWLRIVTRCPVRETPALDSIARELGMKDRWQYEEAVIQLLRTDAAAVTYLRTLFGELADALASEKTA